MVFAKVLYILALLLLLAPEDSECKLQYIICRRKTGKWGRCIIKGSQCPGITHLNKACNSPVAHCCVLHRGKSFENINKKTTTRPLGLRKKSRTPIITKHLSTATTEQNST